MVNIMGTNICPKCGREYEWEYRVPTRTRMSEPIYPVFTLRDGVPYVSKDELLSDKDRYRFTCNCPRCDKPNSFDYIISKD